MNDVVNTTLTHLGMIENMPAMQYFSIAALSNSGMKHLKHSPFHYKAMQSDEAARHSAAPSMQMFNGTLVHCATLEPGAFAVRYAIGPDVDKRTKEWKTFLASVPAGVEVIDQQQLEVSHAQAKAIRSLPRVAEILEDGKPEVSLFWVEHVLLEPEGVTVEVLCKARLDWVRIVGTATAPAAIIFDLKTTSDASQQAFERSIATFGYHRQAMWYSRGFHAATGIPVVGFVFGLVESMYPYAATPCMLDDVAMERGAKECGDALKLVARCIHRNDWPSYPSDIQLFSLPAWALKEAA